MKTSIIVTTAMGLEAVLKRELLDLGYRDLIIEDGKIELEGDLTTLCHLNIWLRTAGRVYLKMGSFFADTFDDLFDKTADLEWEKWIGKNDIFPIYKVSSKNSVLHSKSQCQAIVKKAIVTRLQKKHNVSALPENGIEYPIRLQINKNQVTLSIDSTGQSLSKRGYRAHMDIAPLRETLAAGLVYLSRWRADQDELIDPMCGSGTILIEAAMIGKNIAPGLNRGFLAENWPIIPKKLWENVQEDALSKIKRDADFRVYGSDTNHTALSVARKNAELAGLDNIFFQNRDFRDVQSKRQRGKIITNPPYGLRLGEKEEVQQLYKDLGNACQEHFKDWSTYIITPDKSFEMLYGKKATKKRKLFNGPTECHFYQFY
ncbi:class I SAM-dependent RNA methyltransferase [bacterium]|jgi:putative N6-adenine-specific DNA methylase|nr:class I SAM-dependent RNA methyltransferase [bacterium]